MGHGGDVIDELTTDHREVDDLFEKIQATAPGNPERKRLMDQVTIELVRHSVAEEQYLYPTVRRRLTDGDAIADKEIADHSQVERLLKTLEGLDADAADFNDLVLKLKTEVTAHVHDEETNLFPQLRRACDEADLHKLGESVRRAKKIAPTRPHPSAPDTPPGNKLLAPGAGLVDRARDLVTGRGE
ncbi:MULTISPECIES: hemerythrin domain-containing protein [Streptomyces violaceusniger group]|uniref:Hemerythrin domain-containing protein n=1 Tax=Streptomyces javensis TaxID=114698 RepID=A0ABS0RCC3_9ACTN|nr:hemerythrin domain-containing protein [Streptomyces javensis]MBI0315048.1 hemerythrin domain-containing protein [Streptomyces javensis]